MNSQYNYLKNFILNKYYHYYVLDKLLNNDKYIFNDENQSIMFNQLQIFCNINQTNNINVCIEFDENIQNFLSDYLFNKGIFFSKRHIPTRAGNILHEINFKTINPNILIDIIDFIADNYGEEINKER
jgi:hypothetical protein